MLVFMKYIHRPWGIKKQIGNSVKKIPFFVVGTYIKVITRGSTYYRIWEQVS
jgi:hypothetical protein